MLTNAYFLAKFRFDTAENEPAKKKIANFASLSFAVARGVDLRVLELVAFDHVVRQRDRVDAGPRGREAPRLEHLGLGVRDSKIGKISKFCKFLAGSFSAVSKRNFARKYAFDSIFQALQDLHPFAPLQSQHFRKKSV